MFLMRRARSGYIFLVSVLAIGAIASATTVSMLLLGWAAEQNGNLVVHAVRAQEHARTCAERALYALRNDQWYAGNETVVLEDGSCDILAIGGSGTEDRTLCTQGTSGNNVRRMEITIAETVPRLRISSWEEVSSFSLCP